MFNSNPANRLVSVGVDVVGAYPTIAPDCEHIALGAGASYPRDLEGFAGNGDFIRLPETSTGSVEYFNASGSSVWSASIANVSAAHTEWLGWNLDDSDQLLYVATRGATLTNFIFSSIDIAGTIVNIATVTVTQPSGGSNWSWGRLVAGVSGSGACNFYRDGDGVGDFRMYVFAGVSTDEIIFNVAGGLVQDTTSRRVSAHYKTPRGSFVSGFRPDDAGVGGVLVNLGVLGKQVSVAIPAETGIFWLDNSLTPAGGGYPTVWKGDIVLTFFERTTRGPACFRRSVFDEWIDKLAVSTGLI